MEYQLAKTNILPDLTCSELETLYAQLSTKRGAVPIREMLHSGQTVLAYCLDGGRAVAMASLATYPAVSGIKGWIEDVVVDRDYRNRGIGRKLMEILLDEARHRGIFRVMLYTESDRPAAVHLYESLGFESRDSRIYQLYLQGS